MNPEQNPKAQGFSMPAEWEAHESVWLAWPSAAHLWEENLQPAQMEFVQFCEGIVNLDPATKQARGESLNILVPDHEAKAQAEKALAHLPHRLYEVPFGDIWLRDTAPLFLKNQDGVLGAIRYTFNGWGGKYSLPHDTEVSKRITEIWSRSEPKPTFTSPWITEGGSLEVDGEGSCLTSRQCLLNPNRNPHLNEKQIEQIICDTLGVSKVLWVGDGLINDHTDGHIDTIARYIAPGVVMCMDSSGPDDPNDAIFKQIKSDLEQMTDAKGRKLKVVTIPSPGKVLDEEGEIMPASYLNFYIANSSVIVPIYGSKWDQEAVSKIAEYFPGRSTVGSMARHILSGGGAFHCISQQQPK